MKLGLIWPTVVAFGAVVVLGCGGQTHGEGAAAGSGRAVGSTADASSGVTGPSDGGGPDASVSDGSPPSGSTGDGPWAEVDGSPADGAPANGSAADGSAADGPFGDSSVVTQAVFKLTAVEYANTVSDLVGIPPSAQTVPLGADTSAGGFTVGGLTTDQGAQTYHDSAVAIASQMVSNLTQLLMPVGCDITGGSICAGSFVDALAPRAFRHGTVDAATTAGLNQIFATIAAAAGGATTSMGFTMGLQAVIEEILQSPYFLYHLEVEEETEGPGTVAVTNYSMANRLSYLLWSSMPDTMLFSAAASGQLVSPAQVASQATRMVADPKAKIGVRNFYQQWFYVDWFTAAGKVGTSTQVLPSGALSATALAAGAGESFANVFNTSLQPAIVDSFDTQVEAALWASSNVMKTLLTGTTVYTNAALAPIFGVTGVTGTTLQPVQVDPTQRVGILSHPLLMATLATESTSHPVKRGRFVLDQIVCQYMIDPPPGVPPFEPPPAGMSLRQDFEMLTATGPFAGKLSIAPSINCAQCHTSLDPIGFLFEPYDTIGQYRTIDDYGQPVDLSNITIVGAGDPNVNVPTSSAMQLAQNLAASDQPNRCLMSNLFRFMAHRQDGPADNAAEAELDAIFAASGQSLPPVLVALTQTPAFLERVNVP